MLQKVQISHDAMFLLFLNKVSNPNEKSRRRRVYHQNEVLYITYGLPYNKKRFSPQAKSYLTFSRPRLRGIFTYYLLLSKNSVRAKLVKSEKVKNSAHSRVRNFLARVDKKDAYYFFENNDLILLKKLFLYGTDVGKGSFNTQGKFIL